MGPSIHKYKAKLWNTMRQLPPCTTSYHALPQQYLASPVHAGLCPEVSLIKGVPMPNHYFAVPLYAILYQGHIDWLQPYSLTELLSNLF
jgi:hypothetical protein